MAKTGFHFAICALLIWVGFPLHAQTSLTEQSLEVLPVEGDQPQFGFRNGSLVAAPIPFRNPTVGNGLALGAAWFFDAGPDAGSSYAGIGGFRTDNGSSGYALGATLRPGSGLWRLSLMAGDVDLTYDFLAGPVGIELNQTGQLYRATLFRNIGSAFSVGAGLRYAETTIRPGPGFGSSLPIEITAALDLDLLKFGVLAEWDTRDNDLYPTTGNAVEFELFQGELRGSTDGDYRKSVLKGSVFRQGFGADGVLAATSTFCWTTDEAPFFDACSLGLADGLRGFPVTRYIGDSLFSAQAEYRGRIPGTRFGYVAFAGLGWVDDAPADLFASDLHAAAGIGARIRLSKSFPVDFSIDYSLNDDGDDVLYIFIGQAF